MLRHNLHAAHAAVVVVRAILGSTVIIATILRRSRHRLHSSLGGQLHLLEGSRVLHHLLLLDLVVLVLLEVCETALIQGRLHLIVFFEVHLLLSFELFIQGNDEVIVTLSVLQNELSFVSHEVVGCGRY